LGVLCDVGVGGNFVGGGFLKCWLGALKCGVHWAVPFWGWVGCAKCGSDIYWFRGVVSKVCCVF